MNAMDEFRFAIIGRRGLLRRPFLLDTWVFIDYSIYMLSGIRIFSSDKYWQQILSDLNAGLVSDPMLADVNIDTLGLKLPINLIELKTAIIAASDGSDVLKKIFGKNVSLSPLQTQIVVKLYQSGGMTADELKMALGYAQTTTTHTVETAIYGLRKLFGHEFIKNENGIFKIGGI